MTVTDMNWYLKYLHSCQDSNACIWNFFAKEPNFQIKFMTPDDFKGMQTNEFNLRLLAIIHSLIYVYIHTCLGRHMLSFLGYSPRKILHYLVDRL